MTGLARQVALEKEGALPGTLFHDWYPFSVQSDSFVVYDRCGAPYETALPS